MPHKDVLFHLGTGEAQAFLVGSVEVVEVDGELLARCLSDADDHLGGQSEVDVSDTCGGG